MLKTAFLAASVAVISSASFAGDFTVYQGNPNSGKVLGTCSTGSECAAIRRANPGRGESVVNNRTGEIRNAPGNSNSKVQAAQKGGWKQ